MLEFLSVHVKPAQEIPLERGLRNKTSQEIWVELISSIRYDNHDLLSIIN